MLLTTSLFVSCSQSKIQTEVVDFSVPLKELFSEVISDFQEKDTLQRSKLLFITSGDCSFCIAKFFEFRDFVLKNNDVLKDVDIFSVMVTSFLPMLEFNMEKIINSTNISLEIPVYIDLRSGFFDLNAETIEHAEIVFTNKSNEILYKGAPFSNQKDFSRLMKVLQLKK